MASEDIITLPNIITLCRILLLPFFIIAVVNNNREIAVLLFAAISLSDALDGLSARIMRQKTNIGALLDSTTDWLVILSALILPIFIKGYLSVPMIVILLIPAVIGLVVKLIYIKKGKKTSPTIIGKLTVAFAYLTIITVLIDFKYKNIFLTLAALLAYATVVNYIIKDIRLFRK